MKKKNFFKRIIILVGEIFILLSVTTVMLLSSEIFIRWYYKDVLSSSHGRTYFHNRSWPIFAKERNALGLRGRHFDINSRHALRVVVLGDSLAYGQGVYPYDQRFPEQAAKIFQKIHPDLDVEFINVGIAGHDLPQHNKYLANFVVKLKPDYVLYQWYINDMDIFHNLAAFTSPPLISNRKIHTYMSSNSVLYFLLQKTWCQFRIKTGLQNNYTEYLVKKFNNPDNKHSLTAKKYLKVLLDRLKKEQIAHGIVLFPSFSNKISEYKLGFMHQQVQKVCEDYHIKCLDLREVYTNYDDDITRLWANVFDRHPSALAHSIAAKEIVSFFGDEWATMTSNK